MTHSDELVERVARAIRQQYEAEYEEDPGDWWCKQLARAALSAMPGHELRIGGFVLRPAPNGIWIGRDGEGGEFAAEHVERVIAQFYGMVEQTNHHTAEASDSEQSGLGE